MLSCPGRNPRISLSERHAQQPSHGSRVEAGNDDARLISIRGRSRSSSRSKHGREFLPFIWSADSAREVPKRQIPVAWATSTYLARSCQFPRYDASARYTAPHSPAAAKHLVCSTKFIHHTQLYTKATAAEASSTITHYL